MMREIRDLEARMDAVEKRVRGLEEYAGIAETEPTRGLAAPAVDDPGKRELERVGHDQGFLQQEREEARARADADKMRARVAELTNEVIEADTARARAEHEAETLRARVAELEAERGELEQ